MDAVGEKIAGNWSRVFDGAAEAGVLDGDADEEEGRAEEPEGWEKLESDGCRC
jgi:hypothetical protein